MKSKHPIRICLFFAILTTALLAVVSLSGCGGDKTYTTQSAKSASTSKLFDAYQNNKKRIQKANAPPYQLMKQEMIIQNEINRRGSVLQSFADEYVPKKRDTRCQTDAEYFLMNVTLCNSVGLPGGNNNPQFEDKLLKDGAWGKYVQNGDTQPEITNKAGFIETVKKIRNQ